MPKSFLLGNRAFEENAEPFTIAEVGINHNGSVALAKQLIDVAKEVGVDAVKFQTFKAAEFCSNKEQMFTYKSQGKTVTESMLEMFKRYEFSPSQWREIYDYCGERQIEFLSTPQNISDLEILMGLGVRAIKIGSDDFNNLPLLQEYRKTNLPIILSCGMADLGEIYRSLEVIGALDGYPLALLYCTSQYPTPPSDVNLRKLAVLRTAFPDVVLGFSDHTEGSTAAIASVVYGAKIFEKHFTLSHDLPGPDHWFSANPDGLRHWQNGIQEAWAMQGSSCFRPPENERKMRDIARRSVVALRDIAPGEMFSHLNVGLKRPGTGLPPASLDVFIGQPSRGAIRGGHQLKITDIG